MERRLIEGGILAGALGGLIAFVFARIFAEPLIQQAIDYEGARDAAQAALDKAAGLPMAAEGSELFSRTVQANVGIGVALVFFGAAMGALYAVIYAVALGRSGMLKPRSLAFVLAGLAITATYLVPFAKYPANPPAIGHEDTIQARTGLYLLVLGCSVAFMVLAVFVGKRLKPRFGSYTAMILAAVGYLALMGIVFAILPSLGHLDVNVQEYGRHATETPLPLKSPDGAIVFPGFPADTLAQFRVYSLAAQLLLWTTIALVFAPIADRILTGKKSPAREPATTAV
jgi:hypothetical protein